MLSTTAGRLALVGFWTLLGAVSGLQIQISMLSHGHSWARVITCQVLVWSLWIAFTVAIVALLRRVPLAPWRPAALLLHGAAALALGLVHAAAWVAAELLLVPYDFMNPTEFGPRFEAVAAAQMPLELLLYALVALAHHVHGWRAGERERERRAAQLEASLARARLHALQLQTQPHFLFNTLNGIGALVRAGRNPEALEMIGGLSDLLRYALERGPGGTVSLGEEAGTLERYLEIQRVRFADRLAVELSLAPEARRAAVPPLLLQPLAENAVRHGISRSEAPGRIAVRAAREADRVVIEVFNTGRLDPARRDGIGLSTTAARLSSLYGDAARFELSEADGGVLARLVLPYREAS